MPDLITLTTLLSLAGVSAAGAQDPAAARPGPEHARLGYFVGTWKVDMDLQPSPFGPGGKLTTTDRCEWFEGNFTVVCQSEGVGPMGLSKSIELMSFDPEARTYTYYSVGNTPMTMATVTKGTLQGKIWTWTNEFVVGGNSVKGRVTVTEVSASQYTLKAEVFGADGKWVTTLEGTATRMP